MADVLRFAVPWSAGIAVLMPDGEEPAPVDGARVHAVSRSEAEDAAALVDRLRGMRGEDGLEFLLVPPQSREWLESRPGVAATLERSFDPVGSDASAGSLYSLYEASENRRSGPDGLPLPPVHLVRITSGCAKQARTSLDRMYRSFYEGGAQGAGWIRDMVARAGADVARMDTILDFGSGAGRVIRHWRGLERPQLHGSDYNPYLSGWCADNLPFARFAVNELEPPLPYGDGQFDLVYSISIFTHLDEDLQRPWIEELARIVRPGGLVLVTVSGEQRAADHLPAPDRERFERGELVVKRSVLSGMNACAAYHPAAYIRAALARGFELVEHAPNGAPDVRQDAVLLRVPV